MQSACHCEETTNVGSKPWQRLMVFRNRANCEECFRGAYLIFSFSAWSPSARLPLPPPSALPFFFSLCSKSERARKQTHCYQTGRRSCPQRAECRKDHEREQEN